MKRAAAICFAAVLLVFAGIFASQGQLNVSQQFVRLGSSSPWNCNVSMSSKTTTQCEAAPGAGLRAYVTDIEIVTSTAGSATTIQVEYGTGTNCGSTSAALSPAYANTAAGNVLALGMNTPLIPVAADEICVVQAGTTAGTSAVYLNGFIAP